MPELVSIPLADLIVDEANPRLATPYEGQRETLRALAQIQGPKLRVLAEDILTHGMELEGVPNRYVVLDGNRRLTALRALENPEFLVDAVTPTVVNATRRLSRQYQEAPLDTVLCAVFNDREEANHWLRLRHMGEARGAGAVLWEPDESARFLARTERPGIHTQALDFLEGRGDITREFRGTVATTTYRRLMESPNVRAKIGIEWSNRTLKAVGDVNLVARALLHIATDIATRQIVVGDVYTREQRIGYANSLPRDILVNRTLRPNQAIPLITYGAEQGSQAQPTAATRRTRPRDRLIPRDCVLNVTDPRLRDIERELRQFSLENFPNATSVLFRVFWELSADAYINRMGLATSVDARLDAKVRDVTDDLLRRDRLTQQQARPVRRALQRESYLGPSITVLPQYIHNLHMFPGPADLRADWNNLQPWFIAVWPPTA